MSKQRYVQDSFWTDPYVETLNSEEKLLFLYYLTNPLCNIAGIYEIRDSRVSYDTGIKNVSKIKKKFEKDGKILINQDWIILKHFAKHQSINPKVKEGMQRIINALPASIKAMKGFDSLSHFTLLNLTYISAKAESMQTVNYDTNEYEEEKPKSHKRDDVIKLAKLFDTMATNYYGKPIITPKSYFIVLSAINTHKMKPKGIELLFKDWFDNPDVKPENKVKLSWCLGKDNINSFKVKN